MRKCIIVCLFAFTLIVTGLCLCQTGFAKESCVEEVVCVETIEQGQQVEFFVRNLLAENLVLIFEMELTNMTATARFPYAASYPPQIRAHAFTLTQQDRSKPREYQYSYTWGTEPEPACSEDVVCVTPIWQGDQLTFLVENRQATNVTITFTMEVKNMTSSVEFPYTATYPGLRTTRAFTLSIDDTSDVWNYDYHFDWTWGNLSATHDDNMLYELPYQSGTAHEVIQGFNGTFSHSGDYQYAIDWAMPEGTPVCAAHSGIVVGVEESHTTGGSNKDYQNASNYVRIQHDDGTIGEYDHLKPGGAEVEIGQEVETGEVIGFSGNTGYSTRPHLHVVVYKAVDGRQRQSFPIKFRTREQTPATLEEGKTYTAY